MQSKINLMSPLQVAVGLKSGIVQIYSQKNLVDQFNASGEIDNLKNKSIAISITNFSRHGSCDDIWKTRTGGTRSSTGHEK